MNNDKTTVTYVGAKLHKGQIKLFRDICKLNKLIHTIVAPRGWGKTFFVSNLMLYYAINDPGCKIMYTSKVGSQWADMKRQLETMTEGTGLLDRWLGSEKSYVLNNGSEIFFRSIQLPENIRGGQLTYLFCDEAATYGENVFNEILRGKMRVKGKKVFLISTPKGLNWFYDMFKLADKDSPNYSDTHYSFQGDSQDNEYFLEVWNSITPGSMPEFLYRQEFLGEFLVDGGGVFGANLEKCQVLEEWPKYDPKETYFAGIDIGFHNDYTVLTIVNSKNEVVYIYRANLKDAHTYDTLAREIGLLLNSYNVRKCLIEKNFNEVFCAAVMKTHRSVEMWHTSNESKKNIIEELIYLVQDMNIKLPKQILHMYLVKEMSDFGFKYLQGGRIQYGAITGHDDCVMSLAIAFEAKRQKPSTVHSPIRIR